ncbi:MAG: hypothetical protein IJX19_10000 [Clostridia bacterium]|nr:hypothetical protein [Clostridia bacterium]
MEKVFPFPPSPLSLFKNCKKGQDIFAEKAIFPAIFAMEIGKEELYNEKGYGGTLFL